MGKTKYKKPFIRERENTAAFMRDIYSRKVRGFRHKTTDNDIIASQLDDMDVEFEKQTEGQET